MIEFLYKKQFFTIDKSVMEKGKKMISKPHVEENKKKCDIIKLSTLLVSALLLAMSIPLPALAKSEIEISNNAVISYAEISDGLPVASGVSDVRIDGEASGWTALLNSAEIYESAAIKYATSQAESAVSVIEISLPAPVYNSGTITVSLWSPQINENSGLKAYRYDEGAWTNLPLSVRSEYIDLDMTGFSGGVFLITKYPSFRYVHNPALNPKVLKDAIVNPDAIYGFSPNPDSTRLKNYVDALDWSNPSEVAEAKKTREEYHKQNQELYRLIEKLLSEGKDVETIARAVSNRRNELRLESYKNNPEGLAIAKKSNLDTYGNENGPTADSLYEKYGSWQTVLEKALSSNAGMDACLGLYDEYYDIHEMNWK